METMLPMCCFGQLQALCISHEALHAAAAKLPRKQGTVLSRSRGINENRGALKAAMHKICGAADCVTRVIRKVYI